MEIIVGVLAAWGAIMLAWTLAGVLLLPLGNRLPMAVVVACRGESPWLEPYVRGLVWLRETGLIQWDILLLDSGLGPEARTVAQSLSRRYCQVQLISPAEFKEWMEQKDDGTEQ